MTDSAALAVVGIPGSRRVTLLTAAAARAGRPAPRVIPWSHVLTGDARFGAGELIRIDSPGEDPAVDALLRGPGDPTRIAGGPRWYSTLLTGVARLRGGRPLTDPSDLAVLFDKRRCHAVLTAHRVPVPASPTGGVESPPPDWPSVRALADGAGLRRFFVKPAHGSSAAGVVAVETARGGRIQAHTSAELAADGIYNSLRVRRLVGEREVGALIDALAPEHLHIEAWLPKPVVGGRAMDLRVVVIAGRATHAVLRAGAGPMTNLHLGGRRGDLDGAWAAFAERGLDRDHVLAVAERAAAAFPGTLCVGVDLLPAAGWRGVTVGEVNAFGDLLPGLGGLLGRADGLDTYDAQLRALSERYDRVAS